jgi:hypothetical protein
MEYNQSLQANACTEPAVFKASGGGYDVFKAYAEQTSRGHLWKPWSEDEFCEQRDTVDDVIKESDSPAYCDLQSGGGGDTPTDGSCTDDSYEDNDSLSSAVALQSGATGLMVCSGDDDYYSVSVPTGGSATVRIDFSHAEGDVDLAIYQGSEQIDSSTSTDDTESVTLNGGSYTVRVYGYSDAQASYDLAIALH